MPNLLPCLLLLAAAGLALPSTAQTAKSRLPQGRRRGGRRRFSVGELRDRPGDGTRALRRVLGVSPAEQPPSLRVLAQAADLLAACVEAGALPAAALAVSATGLPPPWDVRLGEVATALADGATVEEALPDQGPFAPISAVLRRSARSGSAMAEQLLAAAAELRSDDHFQRLAAAQRVGVLSALPLGLCLLPAFLLLAVVPSVAGLGAGLLH